MPSCPRADVAGCGRYALRSQRLDDGSLTKVLDLAVLNGVCVEVQRHDGGRAGPLDALVLDGQGVVAAWRALALREPAAAEQTEQIADEDEQKEEPDDASKRHHLRWKSRFSPTATASPTLGTVSSTGFVEKAVAHVWLLLVQRLRLRKMLISPKVSSTAVRCPRGRGCLARGPCP